MGKKRLEQSLLFSQAKRIKYSQAFKMFCVQVRTQNSNAKSVKASGSRWCLTFIWILVCVIIEPWFTCMNFIFIYGFSIFHEILKNRFLKAWVDSFEGYCMCLPNKAYCLMWQEGFSVYHAPLSPSGAPDGLADILFSFGERDFIHHNGFCCFC